MNYSVFQLNIWCHGSDCTVQLAWGERQQLSASLKYPAKLLKHLYQNWQQCYLRAYPVLTRGRANDVNLFPEPELVDWKHETEKAEKVLLDTFERWLGGEELLPIRQEIQKKAVGNHSCVELLVACNNIDLVRLPWEAWQLGSKDAPLANLRISRTLLDVRDESVWVEPKPKRGQARILVILGNASELNLQADRKALQVLSKVAKVEFVQFERRQKAEGRGQKDEEPFPCASEIRDFRQRITKAIADERGWDMLIFAGHSQEANLTGGIIELAPQVFLSISEISSALLQAKEWGLKVAIFNSCSGLSIAQSLIKLGCPQVLVMRERIHDEVAEVFLKQLCQSLAAYRDIQQAMLDACQYCEQEKITYPSAYLIPSLFRHPSLPTELFHFERSRWKRFRRDWQPSRREAIAFGATVLLSLMLPVQDLLFDLRTFTQAFYRQQTQQLPSNPQLPVLLVAVDQESMNEASKEIDQFKRKPIDRQYLAQLVDRLRELNAKTVGIDYILDTEEPKQEYLSQALRTTVAEMGTWLVFAVNEREKLEVFPQIAQKSWSLGGDIQFLSWDVTFPEDATCQNRCPFAYSLALAHTLNREDDLPSELQPRLENKGEFQQEVSTYLQQEPEMIASLEKQVHSPLGLRSIIDFSLPPQQTYQQIPANKFSKGTFPQIKEQVVIIAAGGYDEADDTFSVPLALRYWCRVEHSSKQNFTCPQVFTGGEVHAYMVHHLLSQHQVLLIPDWWLIVIAALLGKGATLWLLQQEQQQRYLWGKGLVSVAAISGIVSLQVYISALLLIPWLLPSVVFLIYISPVLRKKTYA
ncbi:MAG: CHASE2 domain-containing protein [Symploca sp. SIO2C1]|nr:CHASE2 domain-containing protein [Symploca sp. SIO2C1]